MTTGKKIFVGVGVAAAAAFILFNLYIMFGYGYESRATVNEAIAASRPMREAVMAFRASNGRWPGEADAGRFRVADPGPARSIAYDAAQKGVVITMSGSRYEGKRFIFAGEDRDGVPAWSCRPIDIEAKYLPAACR